MTRTCLSPKSLSRLYVSIQHDFLSPRPGLFAARDIYTTLYSSKSDSELVAFDGVEVMSMEKQISTSIAKR